MNVTRYILCTALYLWAGVGFAAESSMVSQSASQSSIPAFYTISRSDMNNHWTIASSEIAEPITFTEQEFITILKQAPSDVTTPFLQGGNPISFIKYLVTINGESLHRGNAPAHSQKGADVSAGNSAAGTSVSQRSLAGNQQTRDRMKALVRQLPRSRTMHRILTQRDIEAPYRTLQANGQKSQLIARRDKIKSELDSAWKLGKLTIWKAWAWHKKAELCALNRLIEQEVLNQLHDIRMHNSLVGESIVDHIASQWPYNIEGPFTPDKVQIIQDHVNKVGINELGATQALLAEVKFAELCVNVADTADVNQIRAVQAEIQKRIVSAENTHDAQIWKNRYDRLQAVIDDPNFSKLVEFKKATSPEQAYLIRREMESTPMSRDMGDAMRHAWCQKEGAIDFARLPEAEREVKLASYQAQKIAAEKGLVLDNATLDSSSTGVLQTNPSEVASNKLEDTTDMVTTTPTDADLLAKYVTADPRKNFDEFTHQFAELLQAAGETGLLTAERITFFTAGVAEGAALRAADIATDPIKFAREMIQGNVALVQSMGSLMYDIITAPSGEFVTPAQMEAYEQRITARMEAVIRTYNAISEKMETMSSREFGNLIGRLGIDYAIAKGGPKAVGAVTDALVRLEGTAISGSAFFEGLHQRLGVFRENPQFVTPEGITLSVPAATKTAAQIAADAKAAAEAAQAIAQGVTATIPTGDAGNLLRQDNQSAMGGGDSSIAKYSFKNGRYEDASYHSAKGNSVKSAKPLDGQHALDNSIKIKDASPSRIAISNDQFVVLMETSPGLYHGHVRQWKELNIYMQNVLKEAGLVRPNGKIVR